MTHCVVAGLPMLNLPIKRYDALIAAVTLALTAPAVGAREGEVDNPRILDCVEGGCRYMEASGEHTKEALSLILGKEDPHGQNTVIYHDLGCDWSALSPKEAHLTKGGSGEPDGEHQMIFSEDEVGPKGDNRIWDSLFGEAQVSTVRVTPDEGEWTAYHKPGRMVCPGLTMNIPGGDEASGGMHVSGDGNELTLEALDPEFASVSMRRAGPALFVGEVDVQADGGTMTLEYVTGFLDADFALGLIYAELEQQGMTCTLERRFVVNGRGADDA